MDAAGAPEGTAVAALLERAYRMALVLRRQAGGVRDGQGGDDLELIAVSDEVVALLDEARAALVAGITNRRRRESGCATAP